MAKRPYSPLYFGFHPFDLGYVPNEPSTWTHKYATLVEDLQMCTYTGLTEPNSKREYTAPAGMTVKIVSVHGDGSVGITDSLESSVQGASVPFNTLWKLRMSPEDDNKQREEN